MSEEEWVKEAMTDDILVAEVLLTLVQLQPTPPSLLPDGSRALQLEWSVRQRRSKQVLRKKGKPTRASPTTPLSWSSGASVSAGDAADGSEESSRSLLKLVDNARSKVVATNQTTPPKRSRRKKTLVELKEEMSSHLKENKSLKNELEMIKLKFEKLRTTNETMSTKLKCEKEKAMMESSKRMKLEYQSHEETPKATKAYHEPKNEVSDLSKQREAACRIRCNENDPYLPTESSPKVSDAFFTLPDLNLPVEDA